MPIRLIRQLGAVASALVAGAAFLPHAPAPRHVDPAAVLDTAIARMGGEATLRRIDRVRFEMLTLWHRLTFDDRPNDLDIGFERHSDLRSYTLHAWLNTRQFLDGSATPRQVIDLVRDSAAIRRLPRPDGTLAPWAPLNIAYLDERREVFAFAPERLLLAARAAPDLHALADTIIGGAPHARLSATVAGFPTTIVIRRGNGLLTMARYHAAQPNDFGLAPWGDMEVELWYSKWTRYPVPGTEGVAYPAQTDVRRVGRPYKRVTILSANFDAAAPSDSFAISDSLRAAFVATATRPMWEFPMDSARIVDHRFALLGPPGQSQAAVKLGDRWLFLEGAIAPRRNETDARWLAGADPASSIAGVIVTIPNGGLGGAAWLAQRKLPVYVAPGAAAAIHATLANWKQPRAAATVLAKPRWLRIGSDSAWVETIDYPDAPGALVAYVPSLRWVYSGMAFTPVNLDLLMARVRDRGWTVERAGSFRAVTVPVPGRAASR